MARCILEVDTSDVQKKAYALAAMLSEQEGKAMLYAAFKRTGGHTRQIMKKDLPKEYEIGATRVGQAVQNAKVSISNLGVNCLIPIVGKRGAIGSTYRATGGAHGWASMHRKYTITARIVKSGRSRLPEQMNNIGGQPPFPQLFRAESQPRGLYARRAGASAHSVRDGHCHSADAGQPFRRGRAAGFSAVSGRAYRARICISRTEMQVKRCCRN